MSGTDALLLGHWGQANILAVFWSSSRVSMVVCIYAECVVKRVKEREGEKRKRARLIY